MEQDLEANIELLKRRREDNREKLAELALFGQIILVEVIHDEPEEPIIFEVPD